MTLVLSGTSGVALDSIKNSLMFLETAKATTSGTSIDFTGIPSWAKKITVLLNNISTNGTSVVQIQVGTSGGFQTTGYNCEVYTIQTTGQGVLSASTGHLIQFNSNASDIIRGQIQFILIDASTGAWVSTSYNQYRTGVVSALGSTTKTLSGTLDRVRLTTVNGTDTFDAGTINILIEGYV